MKSDINGCSVCPIASENFEHFWSEISNREMVQYDFRDTDGQLFSCIAPTLTEARNRRIKWIEAKEY
jgi:hypothetical protein